MKGCDIMKNNVNERKNHLEETVCCEEYVPPNAIQAEEKPKVPFRIKVRNFLLFPVPLGAILFFIILSAQIGFDVYAFINLF